MKPLRVLIVDDEPLARENLRLILAEIPGTAVVGECGDGDSAVAAIGRLLPDVVLLDVEMPGCNGLEVIRRLDVDTLPFVVFVTAYDQYAVEAFRVEAIDYVLKPVDEASLVEALRRAREATQWGALRDYARSLETSRESDSVMAGSPRAVAALRKIVVPRGDRVELLDVDLIDWIGAAGVYVEVHVGKRVYLLRETLTALENRLDPDRFVRIHRSSLVNLERVRSLYPETHGDSIVVLQDGTQLRLSRRYRRRLESTLRQRI